MQGDNKVEDLVYDISFDPPRECLATVEEGLHAFNLAHLGREVIDRYDRVLVTARDERGRLVGGVYGEMYWDWLHIDTLWVEETRQRRGIGTHLLRRLEEAAISKGFRGSHLETTDFQALEFYLHNGYKVFGRLEGKPAGSTWYYLKKRFDLE